ncbi:hypothetical protein WG66_004608 [Moniliophthora roreri]|nr:hypothetical protein WG66_004608 [Moniliophthora roreri]
MARKAMARQSYWAAGTALEMNLVLKDHETRRDGCSSWWEAGTLDLHVRCTFVSDVHHAFISATFSLRNIYNLLNRLNPIASGDKDQCSNQRRAEFCDIHERIGLLEEEIRRLKSEHHSRTAICRLPSELLSRISCYAFHTLPELL